MRKVFVLFFTAGLLLYMSGCNTGYIATDTYNSSEQSEKTPQDEKKTEELLCNNDTATNDDALADNVFEEANYLHKDDLQCQYDTGEYKIVKFYYWDGYDWDYRFPYHIEHISNENFWETFAELMYSHNGILIDNIWVEKEVLYVDLNQSMIRYFRVGWGSIIWVAAITHTLFSLPCVSDVVFLLDGGEMPVIYNEFCINRRKFTWEDEDHVFNTDIRMFFPSSSY